MPTLYKLVIADASCFILLDKINRLNLLKQLFSEVVTTQKIAQEFGKELPNWILIESVTDRKYQAALELEVDQGEASAIALSTEKTNALLILDDLPARNLAKKLGLSFAGTLGIIARASREGVIDSVKPVVQEIRNTNFRFSEEVFTAIIKAAGEEQPG